jgi:hypothetical protein
MLLQTSSRVVSSRVRVVSCHVVSRRVASRRGLAGVREQGRDRDNYEGRVRGEQRGQGTGGNNLYLLTHAHNHVGGKENRWGS